MSLARLALRICIVKALKNSIVDPVTQAVVWPTRVGPNVFDSRIADWDSLADRSLRDADDRPYICIYTDGGAVSNKQIALRELIAVSASVSLVLEFAISSAMTDENEDGESVIVGTGASDTDEEFERHQDLVSREILDTLQNPTNFWAQLASQFVLFGKGIDWSRTNDASGGQRLAAHQIKIQVELCEDPIKGEFIEPNSCFGMFISTLNSSADPGDQANAAVFNSILSGANNYEQLLMRRMGMTLAEVEALGLNVMQGGPPITSMTILPTGQPPITVP